MMTDDYVAGFVDGEGCFSLFEARRTYPDFRTVLKIANSNRTVLERVQSHLGAGTICLTKKETDTSKAGYQLTIGPLELRTILPRLIPRLIVKREVASLIQAFYDLGRGKHDEKRALVEQCRMLNRKGPVF